MSSISDFNKICRICLKNENDLKSLYQSEAANMLTFCQFMEVYENDELPNHICLECYRCLVQSYNFKQKCIFALKTLNKILEENVMQTDHVNSFEAEERTIFLEGVKEVVLQNIYVCIQCNSNFANAQLLQEHLSRSSHKNTPVDIICDGQNNLVNIDADKSQNEENKSYIQNSEDELTSFLEVKTPSLPYKCNDCIQSFTEESDLNLHKSTHTLSNLMCVVCNKKFHTRQILKRHIKIHMVNKPHICQKCGKGYAESHSLTKHMRQHMGLPREKKHFCKECSQGFSEPYYLKVHMRKHTGERPLICSTCGKAFADPRSLKAHNVMHSGEKPYKCHICLKTFSQSVNLTKHIRIHTGEKPYVCAICGKSFSQSSSLDKHNRTHTGEKPYACDVCPKRFAEKGTLTHHKRTHTGEKPYICEICGRTFASLSELKLHDRKHSGIKKNICNICGKDFAAPNNLLVHSRTHTGEKPFECLVCGRKFADKGTLNKHGRLVHVTNKKGIL